MPITFDKIVAIIIVLIGMFLLPIMYGSAHQDAITQAYVYTTVTEFVQEVQLSGYISQDQYNRLMEDLGNTNLMYDISLTHSHDVISPEFNESGDAVVGTSTVQHTVYEDEILSAIFDTDGIYKFEAGDYFSITVRNRTRTYSQKMNQLFLHTSPKYAIIATYGGTIRNEKY